MKQAVKKLQRKRPSHLPRLKLMGKHQLGGRGEAGKHRGFIPIPLNVSKSPQRMPLDLLILVPEFRILLFPTWLYCRVGVVCMH